MKVININDIRKGNEQELEEKLAKRKSDIIDILDHMKQMVEDDQILEFTATSLDVNGDAQIHCYVGDVAAGIGLFEIGKNILMTQYNSDE